MNAVAAPQTLQQAILFFSDPDRCLAEMVRLRWQNGPVACPTCGGTKVSFIKTRRVWECAEKHAKRQFSAKVGTIMEDSAIGLDKWLTAMWLIANAKNGVSSYELARSIGVTQKSAWFMLHRIRLAMHDGDSDSLSGHVEADETFIGGKARNMHPGKRSRVIGGRGTGSVGKVAVMGLLECTSPTKASRIRTKVMTGLRKADVLTEVRRHVVMDGETTVYTDAFKSYEVPASWGRVDLFIHKVIDHATAYVDGVVHTNGMENYWSLLKRMLRGTYVSVEPFHLFRYLDEQAFRFNLRKLNDAGRFAIVAAAVVGKRLTFNALTGQGDPETC